MCVCACVRACVRVTAWRGVAGHTARHVAWLPAGGRTALHEAVRRDDLTGVKLLLMHGAQLHIGDRDGATPTQRALEAHLERGGGEVPSQVLAFLTMVEHYSRGGGGGGGGARGGVRVHGAARELR
jgi:hypothetical protein